MRHHNVAGKPVKIFTLFFYEKGIFLLSVWKSPEAHWLSLSHRVLLWWGWCCLCTPFIGMKRLPWGLHWSFVTYLQAEKPSFPQPPHGKSAPAPWTGWFPSTEFTSVWCLSSARGWAETECAVLTVVNRGQMAFPTLPALLLFILSGISLAAFSARAGCCFTAFAFCVAAP